MKTGKLWKLVAVCSFGIFVGLLGNDRPAQAVICPGGADSCLTEANCANFCIAQTGNPSARCINKCCVCRA